MSEDAVGPACPVTVGFRRATFQGSFQTLAFDLVISRPFAARLEPVEASPLLTGSSSSAPHNSMRSQPVHFALFFAGYVLAAGFAQWLAINPGTGISIWPPSGLFIATLLLTDRGRVAGWLATGLAAELCANWFWFHNPLWVACLLYAGNALCAVTGAWLVARFGGSRDLESMRDVLSLVLFGALIAPIVAATVGAATLFGTNNSRSCRRGGSGGSATPPACSSSRRWSSLGRGAG